jgi:predicted flap endonuclease-1-like 5' DNA nuclease
VSDLPDIGKVARRELGVQGMTTLADVALRTEKELLAIHGVGPKAVRILKEALAAEGKSLKA